MKKKPLFRPSESTWHANVVDVEFSFENLMALGNPQNQSSFADSFSKTCHPLNARLSATDQRGVY